MPMNEVWQQSTGFLAAYTEDKDLMRRIKRYKTKNNWTITAEYYDTRRNGRLFAVQYRIPIEQRRQALRMFGVADLST